ncbi:MAG: sigma 54-interacting transcriptional regulator [Candidatus Hydrogenedentes bacterium]|nr:sigma 54-interacting transcriptional regulator [Candidatus Hydrogenedentota bacterium]
MIRPATDPAGAPPGAGEGVPLRLADPDVALRRILEGTATVTGAAFFQALVRSLAEALQTYGAWVTEYLPAQRRLRALTFWLGDTWLDHYEVDIAGTPCERVIDSARLVHYPENMMALYPGDNEIHELGAVSYMGVPLLDLEGRVMGPMAILDRRAMPPEPRLMALFRIFAARAAAELQRMRAEAAARERGAKLARLVDTALDAIIETDAELRITRLNPAAEKLFGYPCDAALGRPLQTLLAEESRAQVGELLLQVNQRPSGKRYLWIPGGLRGLTRAGESFPGEGTLSRFDLDGASFYTVILRNVHDRIEAEERIQSLSLEREYLREEIQALEHFGEIIGQSAAMKSVLSDMSQVAGTDATVLVLGETGTGKELIARAIHQASGRRDHALVRINCAAIPAALMESELFGHVEGAFTGATRKRDGRFLLAHQGTLFLDEVGELPLDLQSKLLRVLQEGEFEPVGSAHTQKVDVRIIAATNRDLRKEVDGGTFREDLYYRLKVFPLRMPPMRERGDDVVLLAESFAAAFAGKMGRRLRPLTEGCRQRLRAYAWPGNVRELQNVIERAVILSRDGMLNLDRALPEVLAPPCIEEGGEGLAEVGRVLTARELQALEKENITRALNACGWRVSGSTGAAGLLGMNPSTLNSRIKALGIQKPSKT